MLQFLAKEILYRWRIIVRQTNNRKNQCKFVVATRYYIATIVTIVTTARTCANSS